MPADRTYRIRIQTVGDASAAQSTTAALNDAAGATKKGTAANESADKSLVELLEHSRGFHRLLHGIAEMSPAAGLGLMAAFSGPQAAIMGLIMLVHALKRGEEEAAKEAVEFAKEAGKGWGDIQGIINGVIDAMVKSDQEHANWSKHLGEDTKAISTALDLEIAKLKAEAEAVKGVIAATHDAALAKLELHKDELTPEQYAARKAKIEADKRLGETSVDDTVGKIELARVEDARDKAKKEADDAKSAEVKAFEASEDAKRHVNAETLKTKAEADKKAAEELKEKLTAAQSRTAEANLPSSLRGMWDIIGTIGSLGMNRRMGQQMDSQALQKAEKQEDEVAKEFRERNNLARQESDKAAQAAKEQHQLEIDAAEAKKKADNAVSQAKELEAKAKTLAAQVSAAEQGRKEAEPMKRLPELTPTPFGKAAVGDVAWGEEIARKLSDTVGRYMQEHPWVNRRDAAHAVAQEKAEVTSEDRKRLMRLASDATHSKLDLSGAIATLEAARRNKDEESKFIVELVGVMKSMAQNLGPISSMRGDLDWIKAQVRALQSNPATRTLPGQQ